MLKLKINLSQICRLEKNLTKTISPKLRKDIILVYLLEKIFYQFFFFEKTKIIKLVKT